MARKNPYPKFDKTFHSRLALARKHLYKRGANRRHQFTRAFDRCFEMYDGAAIVWALMDDATSALDQRRDTGLKAAIRSMDAWEPWSRVYEAAPDAVAAEWQKMEATKAELSAREAEYSTAREALQAARAASKAAQLDLFA